MLQVQIASVNIKYLRVLQDVVLKNYLKKKDGTPNAIGKFYNAKSLADLTNRDNKEIAETPDYKPKVSIIDKVKEKIGKLRKK